MRSSARGRSDSPNRSTMSSASPYLSRRTRSARQGDQRRDEVAAARALAALTKEDVPIPSSKPTTSNRSASVPNTSSETSGSPRVVVGSARRRTRGDRKRRRPRPIDIAGTATNWKRGRTKVVKSSGRSSQSQEQPQAYRLWRRRRASDHSRRVPGRGRGHGSPSFGTTLGHRAAYPGYWELTLSRRSFARALRGLSRL